MLLYISSYLINYEDNSDQIIQEPGFQVLVNLNAFCSPIWYDNGFQNLHGSIYFTSLISFVDIPSKGLIRHNPYVGWNSKIHLAYYTWKMDRYRCKLEPQ